MEVQSRRSGDVLHQPHAITALFDSALILLLNVWGGRRARLLPSELSRAMADIKKCVDVLHLYEKRYPVAGRKCDIIAEILNRGSGNTPRSSNPSLKRPIPEDIENDLDNNANAPRQRLSDTTAAQQLEQLELSIKQTDHLFALPLYTQELGVLPIYESFDFQFSFDPHQTPSPPSSNSSSGFRFSSTDLAQSGYVTPGDESQQFNDAYSWHDWRGYADPEHSH